MLITVKGRGMRLPGPWMLMLFAIIATELTSAPEAESVVVVANRSMKGSLQVARHYLQQRSIPEDNLIILKAPTEEHISREDYTETIHNPLLRALIERGLVDVFEGPRDDLGRETATLFTSKVRYLVLCYGIPTKVKEVPGEQLGLDEAYLARYFKRARPSLYEGFASGRMARTEASVDGELVTLLQRDLPLRGFLPNPLYKQRNPRRFAELLRVTRLDGPSPDAVIGMIDNALEGERRGLRGRAYVDEDGRGGSYQKGNDWMAGSSKIFSGLHFDTDHDKSRTTLPEDARFDAPVLYAGWYAGNCNGPFTLPGFRFPEGAVAVHLFSFSASQIRSSSRGWVGPFVERGVSATVGNVAEPYLDYTHNFDLFFAALAGGWNFADAAYFALPVLSWQAVAVGDPLFRPFAVPLSEQLDNLGDPAEITMDQYVVIREINRLLANGDKEAALRLADRGMRESPGTALALRRAQLLKEEDRQKALSSLSLVSGLSPNGASEWGLFAETADLLAEMGAPGEALSLYRQLADTEMPETVKTAYLQRGIPVAEAAGESRLAIEWRAETTANLPKEVENSSSTAKD